MPLLDQVSVIREDYRDLLVESLSHEDKTLEEEALKGSVERYGEDTIVNTAVSIVHRVMSKDVPLIKHLIWAVGFLDDMDTLGMEIRFKR